MADAGNRKVQVTVNPRLAQIARPPYSEPSDLASDVIRLCIGYGRQDTHMPVLSDGRDNASPSAGEPYDGITWQEIISMAANPPSIEKLSGTWVIPSSYREFDARNHDTQRREGKYWMLAVDVDDGNPSEQRVAAAVRAVIGDAGFLIYASPSAQRKRRKWRVLVPLGRPIAGTDYSVTQACLFDLLETQGLVVDRALARAGQLVYLPNRGEWYHWAWYEGDPLVLTDGHPIVEALQKVPTPAPKPSEPRKSKIAAIQRFNDTHPIYSLLEKYGYEENARGDYRSPMQKTRSFATRDFDTHWVSLSGSDRNANLGRETAAGYSFGDAFDLYAYFEHANNHRRALFHLQQQAVAAFKPPAAHKIERALRALRRA